jgi:hypothetical protein
MPKTPQSIIAFYEEFRGKTGWNSLEGMRVFLPHLFGARSFNGYHLFTSHEIFCISQFADYADREFAPLLSIVSPSAALLRF